MPFSQIGGGPIQAASNVITVENLVAAYDKDQWLLSSARIPIEESNPGIHINEIAGSCCL
jgi:hypothetical protein